MTEPTAADVARARAFCDEHDIADVQRGPFPDYMAGEDGDSLCTSEWIAALMADARAELAAAPTHPEGRT